MQANESPDNSYDEAMVHVPRQAGFAENLQDQMEHAQEVIEEVKTQVVSFVKRRPGVAIAGAVALGYFIGRAAARRWLR